MINLLRSMVRKFVIAVIIVKTIIIVVIVVEGVGLVRWLVN